MSKETTRRDLFKMATVAGASLVGAGVMGYAAGSPVKAADATWPWPLTKRINTKRAAQDAYENYYVRGCMYGTSVGIAKRVADKLGEPYSMFPWEMTHFGAGGVELWGSTCGTLNGAAMVLGLFVSDTALRRKMCNQLFAWYEATALPNWKPKKPLRDVPKNLPKSVANSPLCHVSVSRWSEESGYDGFSAERADRCGRMCASVAAFTATMLNEARKDLAVAGLKSRDEISDVATGCLGCHGSGDAGLNEPNVLSRMNCEPCHDSESDKTIFPHP